jgi:hypothetical protein
MRILAMVAVAMAAVLTGGCTSNAPGRPLGGVGYVLDKKADRQASSRIWTGTDLPELVALVAQLGNDQLQQQLAEVDPAHEVVVSLYFDACSQEDPELVLDGSVLSVRYRTQLNRNCVRAVDTLVLFAVVRTDLPQKVTYADQEFTLA